MKIINFKSKKLEEKNRLDDSTYDHFLTAFSELVASGSLTAADVMEDAEEAFEKAIRMQTDVISEFVGREKALKIEEATKKNYDLINMEKILDRYIEEINGSND